MSRSLERIHPSYHPELGFSLEPELVGRCKRARVGMIRAFLQTKPPRQGYPQMKSSKHFVLSLDSILVPPMKHNETGVGFAVFSFTTTEGPLRHSLTKVLPAFTARHPRMFTLPEIRPSERGITATGATLVLRITLLLYVCKMAKWPNGVTKRDSRKFQVCPVSSRDREHMVGETMGA
jgi:hypothetical protein